jgi:hypothetical protein
MSKAKLVSDIIATAPAVATAAQAQPRSLTLIGTGIHVLQQASVLIRMGWMADPDMPPIVFGAAGTMQLHLVVGTPSQEYVNAAALVVAEAADIERAAYLRDVEEAAKRQIAHAAKLEADRKREAILAEHRQKLADLEASLAVTE